MFGFGRSKQKKLEDEIIRTNFSEECASLTHKGILKSIDDLKLYDYDIDISELIISMIVVELITFEVMGLNKDINLKFYRLTLNKLNKLIMKNMSKDQVKIRVIEYRDLARLKGLYRNRDLSVLASKKFMDVVCSHVFKVDSKSSKNIFLVTTIRNIVFNRSLVLQGSYQKVIDRCLR